MRSFFLAIDEESEEDSDYREGNDEDCAMEKMKINGMKKKIKRQTRKEKKTPKSENNTIGKFLLWIWNTLLLV